MDRKLVIYSYNGALYDNENRWILAGPPIKMNINSSFSQDPEAHNGERM